MTVTCDTNNNTTETKTSTKERLSDFDREIEQTKPQYCSIILYFYLAILDVFTFFEFRTTT